MYDKLIFPSRIEQVGTKDLIHDNFPLVHLCDVTEDDIFVSDMRLDVSPMLFFEWAYMTMGGGAPILCYCLNLSTTFIVDPPLWMEHVVTKVRNQKLLM